MTDLSAAIAAAREALEGTHPGNDAMEHGRTELRALLAAIDAAQGEAVAWMTAGGDASPLRQPRLDLARLVDAISAAVYDNAKGLSVTEAIGALELAKLELLKEQEQ